jgi:hypothetical protein
MIDDDLIEQEMRRINGFNEEDIIEENDYPYQEKEIIEENDNIDFYGNIKVMMKDGLPYLPPENSIIEKETTNNQQPIQKSSNTNNKEILILLEKAKKEEIELTIKISTIKKSLFNVLMENFPEDKEKILEILSDGIDQSDREMLRSSIKESIKKYFDEQN